MTDPIQPISDEDLLVFRLRVESRHDLEGMTNGVAKLRSILARLSAAEAERDALRGWDRVWRERVDKAEARLAEVENTVSWGVGCVECAKRLDKSYNEHCEIEKSRDAAVARAERLRGALVTIAENPPLSSDACADLARQALAVDAAQPNRAADIAPASVPAETPNWHERR